MARPTGWDILELDGDPTPGVVESVQALAKEFGDFAHDVESAYRSLNSFGSDANALQWVGQTAEAFKGQFGPLPGRLQKLYTSYSEASDALAAYAPKLQAAQAKADSALRQAQDASVDFERATLNANTAAADLKTAQQNHATTPNPQAVADAQTAHDTAQTNLNNAKARMADLSRQAHDAYNDRIEAAKDCTKALHHAQSDGIHNKHWWEHVGEFLSEWGGKIAEIANDLAPFLDVLALATSWIPGVDVVTAGLAEADNLIALAGTGLKIVGDGMQGHWGDALMGAGMLGATFLGGKALGALGGKVLGKLGTEAEGEESSLLNSAEKDTEGSVESDVRTAEGNTPAKCDRDPVDVVSGWMLTNATDVELPGVMQLVLRRAYASGYTTGRLFGSGWSSTLDQRLSINAAGIHFAGDDGQRLDYKLPEDGQELLPQRGERWPLVWDRETDEIRISDPWSGQTRHFTAVHYRDDNGQIRDLTSISDRNGNRITIDRDAQGTPTAVRHSAYSVAVDTIATAAGPRISALRLLDNGNDEPVQMLKQFRYDDRGRLTGVVNSSGLPFTYEWDENDRICAWQDRSGYRYAYVYDEAGRVVRGDGAFLAGTFAYDPANQTTVATNSLGHATTYRYDEHGHVTSETDPLGNTSRIEYDPQGRVLSRTDALGATTTFERDEFGDVRRIVAADDTETLLEYSRLHKIVTVTRADGGTWHRDYDEAGNLTSVTDPAGAVTAYEYDARGALTASVDPLGAVTRYTPDAAGLPIAVVDPLGAVTEAVRDAAGQAVRVTDALGAVTTRKWNPEGLPVSRTGPDGATTHWEHDADGRLLKITNPLGAATVFEPGPLDTVAARTGPDGVRHEFAYDSEQRLSRVTNPTGATWDYYYDSAGRLASESDFNGRQLGYEYDAAGRLAARTTGTGARISLAYDVTGRVVSRDTPEGQFEYLYDAAGRLTSATGPDANLTMQYDLLGQVLVETIDGRATRFAYDAAGRRISRITASGAESVWSYDLAGRPTALTAGTGHLDFAFDAVGRETERLLGPQTWLTRAYDPSGRLAAQNLGTGARFGETDQASENGRLSRSWVYRTDGVPEEIRDSLRGTRRITSDVSGRPTVVTAHGWSETYAYDAFGNLTTSEAGTPGGEHPETESPETARISRTLIHQFGRTHHEYDVAGRVIRTTRRTLDGRRRTWNYTWDSQDRLVRAETPDNGTWRYTYDPTGRRVAKHRIGDGGDAVEQILFTWDGPRLAESETPHPDGTVTVLTWDYEPGTFRPASQRRRTWATDADQADIDEAFHAIVTDLVGTPTELVTSNGDIAWRATTTLWGNTAATTTEDGVDCPLRFPGQYHDPETGLHYNLNRYYNPDTAAYLTPDPLGLAPAPNDHAYVPNPLTWIDPLGLSCGEADAEDPAAAPASPIKTNAELQSDASAIHETWRTRYGERQYNGITVTTGELDGELVVVINQSKINPDATKVIEDLGYRRVFGRRYMAAGETDSEQILLNAVDKGDVGSSGRIAISRVPCGPERQDCSGRLGNGNYPNIRVVGKWGAASDG